MKICPKCLLEFTPDTDKCPNCHVDLVPAYSFTINLEWPHCSNCQTAATESATRCSNCGQSFYLIPFYPHAAAFLIAIGTFLIIGYTLDMMHVATNTIKVIGIITASVVWFILRRRTNLVLQTAPIEWETLSRKTKDILRQEHR